MEPTTFGLSTDKLIKLLGVVQEAQQESSNNTRELVHLRLLDQWLKRSLSNPAEPARSLETLLLDGTCPLGVLTQIKDIAKESVVTAKSTPACDTAKAVYYAAIASAWVHHQHSLSTLNTRQLATAFLDLAHTPWMQKELAELFARAHFLYSSMLENGDG